MAIHRDQAWAYSIAFVVPPGLPFAGQPVDITGLPLRMQIRPAPESALVYCELSTANGRLVIYDGPGGVLHLLLSKTETGAIPAGSHYFDIIRTDTDQPIMGGRLNFNQGVTR